MWRLATSYRNGFDRGYDFRSWMLPDYLESLWQ